METVTKEQLDQIAAWIRTANINIDLLLAQAKELARQRNEAMAEVEMLRSMLKVKQ